MIKHTKSEKEYYNKIRLLASLPNAPVSAENLKDSDLF